MNFLENIKEAGIVGAGGAGFPTHAKLNAQAEFIIMNAAECEPLLRVDQQLMEIYPDEIVKGFELAGRSVNAKEAIIGIKYKHKNVIEILQQTIDKLNLSGYIRIKMLEDMYPAGDEQVLVYEVTGRVVPEAGIPLNVGCVVINSETALNIYFAEKNIPVTQKYITIAGDIPNRKTVKVAVGTPIIDVLKMSGIDDFSDYAVIDGGPMMGPVMAEINGYVTKKTKGFIILKRDHFLIRRKSVTKDQARRVNRATCEQCQMCTDLCPRHLLGHRVEPHKSMRAINLKTDNMEGHVTAQLCSECSLCELFSCPIGLHPKMANKYFKDELANLGIRFNDKKDEYKAKNVREYRSVPSKRLIVRLGLKKFDLAAPMVNDTVNSDVRILMRQHVGAPSEPCVKVGKNVVEGEVIATIPDGSLGVVMHSSVKGIITEVTKDYIDIRRT